MLLYVMRHGPAEDRAASGLDADRALTSAGRDVVKRAANELRRAIGDAHLPRILSSPLRRAQETATILGSIAGTERLSPEVEDDLAADEELPLRLVTELAGRGRDVAIVGHQPTVEHLVRHLSGRHDVLPSGFRTAMVVALVIEGALPGALPTAEIRWVVDPHALG